MRPVPWSRVQSWDCIACGECCREYTVNMGFREWLRVVKQYGVEVTKLGLTEFYLKRRVDGRCVFLYKMGSHWLCGLQNMKPKVCKLWPFKIHSRPMYGRKGEALYLFDSELYYVYIDPSCRGIYCGKPGWKLMNKVIPEFIQLASGKMEVQNYSASQRLLKPHQIVLRISEIP